MRTLLITIFTAFLFFISVNVFSQSNFRFMTYNIRNGKGMDDKTDYKRTADVIKRFRPDVVAIQEVDSVTNRSQKRFVLGELGKLTKMHYTYAPAMDYDGGKYGLGLLSKKKPLNVRTVFMDGKPEPRVLLIAEFKKYVYIVVHLSLKPDEQLISVRVLEEELAKINKPVFIGGDFNDKPHSKTMLGVMASFKVLTPLEYTFPADVPVACIDYIAVDNKSARRITLNNSFVVDEPLASDHRPVILDVKLK